MNRFAMILALLAAIPAQAWDMSKWEGSFHLVGESPTSCPKDLMIAQGHSLALDALFIGQAGEWEFRLGHESGSEDLGTPVRPWAKTVDSTVQDATLREVTVLERCGLSLGFVNCWQKELRVLDRSITVTAVGVDLGDHLATGDARTSGRRECRYARD